MNIQPHHEHALQLRLDELYYSGSCFITLGELTHWFSAKRITKSVYWKINDAWTSLLTAAGWEEELPLTVRYLKTQQSGIRLIRPMNPWLDGEEVTLASLCA